MWLSGIAVFASFVMACGGGAVNSGDDDGSDDGATTADGGPLDAGAPHDAYVEPEPNWDAFFADDPPNPEYCVPEGVEVAKEDTPIPGGTPECPSDKNREGCYCEHPGEMALCWPGKRVDREQGICRDGETTCLAAGEFGGRWGPCEGYVLPTPGATLGAAACNCFSAGTWEIDNLSPCFVNYGTVQAPQIDAVSTFVSGSAEASCPTSISGSVRPAQPQPNTTWSKNRLTVDCAGLFRLCYRLRAGDVNNPRESDCFVIDEDNDGVDDPDNEGTCVDVWYDTPGHPLELDDLPSWTSKPSTTSACARQFYETGGYGEMTVTGLSLECEFINSTGTEEGSAYVFHRVGYCPLSCNTNPSAPECANCSNGQSGSF